MPRTTQPSGSLAQTIADKVDELLSAQGYSKPRRKQIGVLITGLLAGEAATASGLSRALAQDGVSPARESSILRRILRLLAEPDLDPERLLPAVFRTLLPSLLKGVVAAHAANEAAGAGHHARFRPIRLVIDESSEKDTAHLLVLGLWYQGLVLPLTTRVWQQNQPMEEGEYWSQLGDMLWEVQGLLPAVLRDHVLLVADRGYGHPRLLDLLSALGWSWVVRTTGQVRVRFEDGREQRLQDLVPAPGTDWYARTTITSVTAEDEGLPETVAVFKKAGWRQCRIVGVWLAEQKEPWLLLTNLPARPERLAEYAQRWAIERLFLTWKSHGWQLEAGRIRDPKRLGRLMSGLILATWWCFAAAQPRSQAELDRLAGRTTTTGFQQLPLPLMGPVVQDQRPWPAKFSLFSWGRRAIATTDRRCATPPLDWTISLNDMFVPWPERCLRAAAQPLT